VRSFYLAKKEIRKQAEIEEDKDVSSIARYLTDPVAVLIKNNKNKQ